MANNDNDLVLYLPLDDIRSDGSVQDASDYANHGAVMGNVTLVPDDIFGGCLSFNVPNLVGDHITAPIKTGLDLGNRAHTIEGWIYVNAYPTVRSWPLLLGQAGPGAHHWIIDSTGNAQLGVWSGAQFAPKVDKEKWTHIAMVHDGNKLSCYINGTAQGTPKDAAFNLTKTDLIIAKAQIGGAKGESDFSGKIANLRIYKRALSQAEIQRDISVDQMSMVAFRKSHPIDFRAYDDDNQPVLYISDGAEARNLNLELHNSSTQAIQFTNGQNATASADNHHFALRFRPGTLSVSTLDSLINPVERKEILKEADQWDLYFPPRLPAANEPASLYLLYKDSSKSFQHDERLTLTLQRMSAAPGSGARGTQVELIPRQLTAAGGDATPITGSRSQYVHITNHIGKKNIPLHVGFVDGNTVLNDGQSPNTLRLRITNIARDGEITLNPTSSGKPSKFIVSFDARLQGQTKDWALVSSAKSTDVKVSVDEREIRPEGIDGDTPEWPITFEATRILGAGQHIEVKIAGIVSSLPPGHANLYARYENIPGYWDGQFVCAVEKGPIVSNNGNVGIGTIPKYKLDVKSSTPIKLGLEGNGGGQLLIKNEPNDNKIYLEAHSSNGNAHAAQLLITGRNAEPINDLTLRANFTSMSGELSVNRIWGKQNKPLGIAGSPLELNSNVKLAPVCTMTFDPESKIVGIPIIEMKKTTVKGVHNAQPFKHSGSIKFSSMVSSAEAIVSVARFEAFKQEASNNWLVTEEHRVTITQIRDFHVYFDVFYDRVYKYPDHTRTFSFELEILVIATLKNPIPGA